MKQKSSRFVVLFSFSILSLFIAWFGQTRLSQASYRDDNPDFDGTLIDHDETWTKDGQYVFDKQVAIVDGAQLIIEPGTVVSFGRGADGAAIPFQIWDGVVEAVGTEAEPIVFRGVNDTGAFFLDFSNASETQSLFKYVRFLKGGDAWFVDVCSDCQQSFLEKFFVKRALAAQEKTGIETLKYWFGKLQMENIVFSESAFTDISAVDSRVNDIIDDQGNHLRKDPSFLFVRDSDFSGDATVPALQVYEDYCFYFALDCPRKITFENNWYGSSNGPNTDNNFAGLASKYIKGTVNLNGWSTTQFFCLKQCYSNVLFLPGLEASRLYIPDGDDGYQAWEPFENNDAMKLYLDADGKSENQNIYTKDIIDNAYIPIKGNIYKAFIEEMNNLRDNGHMINDWKATPYDWRLTLNDIVNNGTADGGAISYAQSTPTPYIVEELKRLASTSKSRKVTIVAHSNGGLVAKALIKKLGDTESARLIDKLVLVAVPQSGTPQAIGALLHGYDQGLPKDWMPFFLSPQTARTLAHNMPGVYPLLPADSYFSGVGSSVFTSPITFDDGAETDTFISIYGHNIGDATELRNFLLDTTGKVAADSENIVAPSIVNSSLLMYGRDIHQDLDTLSIPQSITIYQIAGFGEETLGTIRYWTGTACTVATNDGRCVRYDSTLEYTPEMVIDGDGTVVAPSALALSTSSPNVKQYWVDLDDYDSPVRLRREHADILEVAQLRDFITENIITQSSSVLPAFISVSEPSTSSEKRLRYYLHSPLALSAHDGTGREISTTADTIPGARFKRFGEVQYISLPAEVHPTVALKGEATGSFTLEIEEVEGNTIVATTTFAGIPSIADSRVTMDFPDGTIEQALPLTIDYDGDGRADYQVNPVINGTATLGDGDDGDTTPPATTMMLTGTEGTNDWYISDVTVALTATDNDGGSGVEKTEYSLDNGAIWNTYTEPLIVSIEGTTRVLFASTDKSNNREETKTRAIKIDKTAPEAKMVFNPDTEQLDIIGTDNLTQDVSVLVIEKPDMKPTSKKAKELKRWFPKWFEKHRRNLPDMLATLTDEAGHTTSIAFEKTKDKKGYIFMRVQAIGYDENETILSNAFAQYKWQIDRKKQYRLFASHLKTTSVDIESHYIPARNETWIMGQSQDLADNDRDDDAERRLVRQKLPGMIIPALLTRQGEVEAAY